MGRAVRSPSPSTCLKTPQYFTEGRLKPFFANNVDIPFARARRLKPCPRKATVRSGKQTRAYFAVYINCVDLIQAFFDGVSNRQCLRWGEHLRAASPQIYENSQNKKMI